ncbi:hypothetical protein AB0D94_29240 [Streptomyces sp. NPDC048255]|uniref:hypothetical protein n=1 Tax=Streptomyces sp. NPDC048255 TaxID=3154713 RepID=UPI0033EE8746
MRDLREGRLGQVVGAVAVLVVAEVGDAPVRMELGLLRFAEPVVGDAGQAVEFAPGVEGDGGRAGLGGVGPVVGTVGPVQGAECPGLVTKAGGGQGDAGVVSEA